MTLQEIGELLGVEPVNSNWLQPILRSHMVIL